MGAKIGLLLPFAFGVSLSFVVGHNPLHPLSVVPREQRFQELKKRQWNEVTTRLIDD